MVLYWKRIFIIFKLSKKIRELYLAYQAGGWNAVWTTMWAGWDRDALIIVGGIVGATLLVGLSVYAYQRVRKPKAKRSPAADP